MFIREMSDLHLEFARLDVPVLENEKDMILILAGDIGLAEMKSTLSDFLNEMGKRHRHVIMILGNHEHYGCSIHRSLEKIKKMIDPEITNVHVLECETLIVDDVAFICSTMWTDVNKRDPMTELTLENGMTDFRVIRTGPPSQPYMRKFRAYDMANIFVRTTNYIFDEIVKHKSEGKKVVVVTHHAPSMESVHARYKHEHHWNGGYASSLDYKIMDTKPNLWFHGHTHTSHDYIIESTRVICNPRGYPRESGLTFNPNMVIEI